MKTLPYYSRVPIQPSEDPPPQAEGCTIFYVGSESLSLTNLLMTHSTSPVSFQVPLSPSLTLSFITSHHHHHHTHTKKVYSYDPKTKTTKLESARTNRLLMRRYVAVQKARDADVFGILVGTLGVGMSQKKTPPPQKKGTNRDSPHTFFF